MTNRVIVFDTDPRARPTRARARFTGLDTATPTRLDDQW